MEEHQERRLNRKYANAVKADETPGRERRCGNCGQLGHLKTNRKCPRWAEFNQPAAGTLGGPASQPTQATGSTPCAGLPNPLSLGLLREGSAPE